MFKVYFFQLCLVWFVRFIFYWLGGCWGLPSLVHPRPCPSLSVLIRPCTSLSLSRPFLSFAWLTCPVLREALLQSDPVLSLSSSLSVLFVKGIEVGFCMFRGLCATSMVQSIRRKRGTSLLRWGECEELDCVRRDWCVYSHRQQKESTNEETQITAWQCSVPGKNHYFQFFFGVVF